MKKIFIVTPINPEARDTGTKLRVFHLARQLHANGFAVYLLVCDNTSAVGQSHPNLRAVCADIRFVGPVAAPSVVSKIRRLAGGMPIPVYAEIRRAINQCVTDWRPDIVQFEKTFTVAQADLAGLAMRGIVTVLEEGGVHHVAYERRVLTARSEFARMLERWRAARLRRYERKLIGAVDAVVAVSADEADLLRSMNAAAKIILAPNGVGERLVEGVAVAQASRRPGLFFCGDPAYAPNADALRWFVHSILPLIAGVQPVLRLVVAGGAGPADLLHGPLADRIEWLGRVPDIHALFDAYTIFVNPMRQGGGTRLKMLEAMAHGMACVSTTVGAEGIEIEPGRQALIADTPEAFGRAINVLADNVAQSAAIGDAARQLVADLYTWPRCARPLVDWYHNVAGIRQ